MIKTEIYLSVLDSMLLSDCLLSLLGKLGIFYYYTVAEMDIFVQKST